MKTLMVPVSDNVYDELVNIGGTFLESPERAATLLLINGVTRHYEDEGMTAVAFLREIIARARVAIAKDFNGFEEGHDGLLRQISEARKILSEVN